MIKKNRFICFLLIAFLLTSCRGAAVTSSLLPIPTNTESANLKMAQTKIKHIVIIMQEKRSFDTYFGTYPGADGIPMQNGVPTVCVPDYKTNECVKPYHDANDVNAGGPHG